MNIVESIPIENPIKEFREFHSAVLDSMDMIVKIMDKNFVGLLKKQTDEYSHFVYREPIYKLMFRGFNEELVPSKSPNYQFDKYGFRILSPEQMCARPHMSNVASCASYGPGAQGRAGQNFYLSSPYWMTVVIYNDSDSKTILKPDHYPMNSDLLGAMTESCKDLPNVLVSMNVCLGIDENANLCVLVSDRFYGELRIYNDSIGKFIEYFSDRGIPVYGIYRSGAVRDQNDTQTIYTPFYQPQICCLHEGRIILPWKYADIPNAEAKVVEESSVIKCRESYLCHTIEYPKIAVSSVKPVVNSSKVSFSELLNALKDAKAEALPVLTKNAGTTNNTCCFCDKPITSGKINIVTKPKDVVKDYLFGVHELLFPERFIHSLSSAEQSNANAHIITCDTCLESRLKDKGNKSKGSIAFTYKDKLIDRNSKFAIAVPLRNASKDADKFSAKVLPLSSFHDKNSVELKEEGLNSSTYYLEVLGLLGKGDIQDFLDSVPEHKYIHKDIEAYINNASVWAHRGLKPVTLLKKLGITGLAFISINKIVHKDGTEIGPFVCITEQGEKSLEESDMFKHYGLSSKEAKLVKIVPEFWSHYNHDLVEANTKLIELIERAEGLEKAS